MLSEVGCTPIIVRRQIFAEFRDQKKIAVSTKKNEKSRIMPRPRRQVIQRIMDLEWRLQLESSLCHSFHVASSKERKCFFPLFCLLYVWLAVYTESSEDETGQAWSLAADTVGCLPSSQLLDNELWLCSGIYLFHTVMYFRGCALIGRSS